LFYKIKFNIMRHTFTFLWLLVGFSMMAQADLIWQEGYPSTGYLFLSGTNTVQTTFDSKGDIICNIPLDNYQDRQTIGLLKYDVDGNLLWSFRYNDTLAISDHLNSMTLDSDDNIIVTGYSITKEEVDYDLIYLEGQGVAAKISSDGELLWRYILSGNDNYIPEYNHTIVDDENNIYITGRMANATGGVITMEKLSPDGDFLYGFSNPDVEEGVIMQKREDELTLLGINRGSSAYDMFVFDNNDVLIGQNTFDVLGNIALKPTMDEEGSIYVTGGTGRFLISKYDRLGNHLWTFEEPTNLPDNVFADELRRITFDEDKNLIVTGRHYGENYGDPENYTNGDILTVQLSPDGEEMRRHRYIGVGDNNAEIGSDIIVYEDGSVFVAGTIFTGLGNPTDAFGLYLDENWEEAWTISYDYSGDKDDRVYDCLAVDNCIFTKGYSYVEGPVTSNHVLTKYDRTTAMKDINLVDFKIELFPNPFTQRVSFSEEIQVLQVCNIDGKKVPFQQDGNGIAFNQELPAGKYYVSFVDEETGIQTQKILKL